MDDEVQQELDRLARVLGRSVSLDAPDGRLLGHSVQSDDVDGARVAAILSRRVPEAVRRWQDRHLAGATSGPVRVPANPGLELSRRLGLPLRGSGALRAHLWVVEGSTDLTAVELDEVRRTGDLLLAALTTRPTAATDPATDPADRLGDLLGDRLGDLLAALVAPGGAQEAERLVAALVAAAPSLRGGTVRFVVALPGAGLAACSGAEVAALRHDRAVVTAGVASTYGLVALGEGPATERLLGRLRGRGLALGVGPVVAVDAPALRRGHACAELAARCARADPRLGPETTWDTLGAYQLLLGAPDADPDAAPDLTAWHEPVDVVAGDDPSATMLRTTLETYLDLAGDAQRTAAALHVHRTTLYYRLDRATALLGVDLADGLVRTRLHVALKALRLAATPRPGRSRPAGRAARP